MFGKKVYTIVCRDAGNVYVRGRVSGMICVLANNIEKHSYANVIRAGKTTMLVETTKRRYRKMKQFLETKYPGLCKFEND